MVFVGVAAKVSVVGYLTRCGVVAPKNIRARAVKNCLVEKISPVEKVDSPKKSFCRSCSILLINY